MEHAGTEPVTPDRRRRWVTPRRAIVMIGVCCAAAFVHEASWSFAPALHRAAYRGDTAAVLRLLEAGVPVDSRASIIGPEFHNLTPVAWAVLGNAPDAIEVLAAHGADVDAPDANNVPPLMLAVSKARLACVRSLLVHGADPHARWNGHRLVDMAGAQGPEYVAAFINAGAGLEPSSGDER